jgi:OHCU decarboxylase
MSDSNTSPVFETSPSSMTAELFVDVFGGVYEHSPWVAERAWSQGIDAQHNTPAGLSETMQQVIANADDKILLELINAHPDLAGKAAAKGELTPESTSEQAGAGIDQCTSEEYEQFQTLNEEYKAKFGFPFIMAVKGSNRHLILAAFVERLPNDPATEFQRAIDEINKIARFRLDAIASGE